MYSLYLPGYQDVIGIPVCRIDRIQDVDLGAEATGTHRGRRVAKPARLSHNFLSHCVLSHLFGIWFRYIMFKKKYSNPVEGHCMKYDACFPSVVQSKVRDTASGVAYCGLGSHRFKSDSSLDVYCIML